MKSELTNYQNIRNQSVQLDFQRQREYKKEYVKLWICRENTTVSHGRGEDDEMQSLGPQNSPGYQ